MGIFESIFNNEAMDVNEKHKQQQQPRQRQQLQLPHLGRKPGQRGKFKFRSAAAKLTEPRPRQPAADEAEGGQDVDRGRHHVLHQLFSGAFAANRQ